MARIEWGDSEDGDMALVKSYVQRLAETVFDNGGTGLVSRVSELEIVDKERQKQHRETRARLNVIIAILGMLALYIGIIITIRGGPKPVSANPFHSSTQVATTQQDTRNPNTTIY